MDTKNALAQFDSWRAAQYFAEQWSVPDREMLEALLNSEERLGMPGDCDLLQVPHGSTVSEIASQLLAEHYP